MNRRSRNVIFARALLETAFKSALVLRGAFVMQVLFMALNNITFFVFWWALMSQVPDLRGWRLGDIQLLFGIVALGVGLAVAVAGGVNDLGRLVDEGQLDTLLAQPKPVLLHALGMRSHAAGLGDMLSGAAFIVWSDQVTWSALPLVVVATVASALVFAASGVVFFSMVFWLGRVDTLARQVWELVITFAVYLEPLFGGVLRLALFTVLPAGFVGYVPARLIHNPSLSDALLVAGAAALYTAIAANVFERGLRRYTSGSRFSAFG